METLVLVGDENTGVLARLLQYYEAEFSFITNKRPNSDGYFQLDYKAFTDIKSFLLYWDNRLAGFAIIQNKDDNSEVLEYYILPCYRRRGLGKVFFEKLIQKYPGQWIIKQLVNAKEAHEFWVNSLRSIDRVTFEEGVLNDAFLGNVTYQTFYYANS